MSNSSGDQLYDQASQQTELSTPKPLSPASPIHKQREKQAASEQPVILEDLLSNPRPFAALERVWLRSLDMVIPGISDTLSKHSYTISKKPKLSRQKLQVESHKSLAWEHRILQRLMEFFLGLYEKGHYADYPGKMKWRGQLILGSQLEPINPQQAALEMLRLERHAIVLCKQADQQEFIHQYIAELFKQSEIEKVTVLYNSDQRVDLESLFHFMGADRCLIYPYQKSWISETVGPRRKGHDRLAGQLAENGQQLRVEQHHFKAMSKENPSGLLKSERDYKDVSSDETYRPVSNLDELLLQIAQDDLKESTAQLIPIGGAVFPHSEQEFHGDAAKIFNIREHLGIIYRHQAWTLNELALNGYEIIEAEDLLHRFEQGLCHPDWISKAIISIPAEHLAVHGALNFWLRSIQRHAQ